MSILISTARHIFGKEKEFYHSKDITQNYKKIGELIETIHIKTRNLLKHFQEKFADQEHISKRDHELVSMVNWLIEFHKEFDDIYEHKKKQLNDPEIKRLLPELQPDEAQAEIIKTQQERIIDLLEEVDARIPEDLSKLNDFELQEAKDMIQESADTWRNFIKEMAQIEDTERELKGFIKIIEDNAKSFTVYTKTGTHKICCYLAKDEDDIHEKMRLMPMLKLKDVTHRDEFYYHAHLDERLLDIEHYTITLKKKDIDIIPPEYKQAFLSLKHKKKDYFEEEEKEGS